MGLGESKSAFFLFLKPVKRTKTEEDEENFWMNGFLGVYSWWPDYANTEICIYSGLTRGRRLFRHFPFLSQFMLILLFAPICVNSSVGISLDGSRLGLKHGQPDDGIFLFFFFKSEVEHTHQSLTYHLYLMQWKNLKNNKYSYLLLRFESQV